LAAASAGVVGLVAEEAQAGAVLVVSAAAALAAAELEEAGRVCLVDPDRFWFPTLSQKARKDGAPGEVGAPEMGSW